MKLVSTSALRHALLPLMISAALAGRASAQTTYYWDGNGATTGSGATTLTGTWGGGSPSAFWGTSAAGTSATSATGPGSLDTAVFSANDGVTADNYNGNYTITLGAAQSVNGIVIAGASVGSSNTGGTPSFVGTGAGLTLGSGGITLNGSSGDVSFASSIGTITLAADQTWTINNGHVLNVAANITGSGGARNFTLGYLNANTAVISGIISDGAGSPVSLVLNNTNGTTGAGTWSLTGANTYSGSTSINQGVLQISSLTTVGGGASSLGSVTTIANGTINMGTGSTGATLNYVGTAASTSDRVINLANNTGTDTIANNSALSTSSLTLTSAETAVSGSKMLVFTGTNTGSNTFSGALTDGSGILTITKSGVGSWNLSGNNTTSGDVNVQAGTLTMNGTDSIGGNINVTGGTATMNGSDSFSNVNVSSGTLTLGGANISFGNLTVTGGALIINGNNDGSGALTVSGGGVVSLSSAASLASASVALNNGFLLVTGNNNSIGVVQVNSGGIGVTVTPTSLPTISDNTLTNGGVYGIGYVGTGGIGSVTAVNNLINGSSYWSVGSFTGFNGTYTGSTLPVGALNTYRIGGGGGTLTLQNAVLTGSGNNVQIGTTASGGTVIIPGGETYTGTTSIINGTASIAAMSSFGTGSSAINIGSGANSVGITYTGTGETSTRVLNFAGTTGTVTLSNSGTGNIVFSGTPTFTGTGNKTIVLGGTSETAGGTIGPIKNPSSGITSLTRNGVNNIVWTLNTGDTYTGTTTINGGVLQTGTTSDLTNSFVNLNGSSGTSQAIWQTQGTLNETLASSGVGNLNWNAYSGFAAKGGSLTLTFNGGAQLVWGAIGADFIGSGVSPMVFGSTTADSQVNLTNAINLNTGDQFNRVIYVEKGTGTDSALLSGLISGGTTAGASATGITKQGKGTLILSNANNTYQGQTLISQGTLVAGGNSAASTSVSTTGVFGSGWGNSSLVSSAYNTIVLGDGNTGAGSNPSLLIGGAFTVGRAVSILDQGTGNVYSIGGSTDAISTFSGAISFANSAGTGNSFNVTQVATTGSDVLNLTGGINGTGTLTFANVGAVNVNTTAISGTEAVVQSGTGTTTLAVADTYTGTTSVTGGKLQLGNANAVQSSTILLSTTNGFGFSSGIGTFNVGGLAGTGTQSLVDTASLGVTLAINNTNATTFSGVLTGAGGVSKAGTGTLTIAGANTYSGTTTITGGVFQVGNGSTGSLGTGPAIVNGGTLAFNAANGTNYTGNITDTTGAVSGAEIATNTNTLSGAITGAGGFAQSGAGVTILAGTDGYTGATTASTGTLSLTGTLTGNTAVSTSGTGVFSEGSSGSITGTTASVTQASTGSSTLGGNNSYTGVTTASAGILSITGTLTASNVSTSGSGGISETSSGVISGTGVTFTQASTGTSTLGGANTYTGATGVSAGVLSLTGTVTGSNVTASGTGVLSETSSGVIAGSAVTLTQSSSGTTVLGGANTFGGATSISGGSVQLANTLALQNSTVSVASNNGLSFASGVGSFTIGGLTGGNTFALTDASSAGVALTLGNNNAAANSTSVISGAGSLIKTGTGTQNLSGLSTYTGGTTVNNGTLDVGVATAGSATAFGNIGNTLTVNSPGTVDLNNANLSVGNLTGSGTILDNNGGAPTLTIGNNNAGGGNFSGSILNHTTGVGVLAVTKVGTGTITLSGSNSYTGVTAVNAGVLNYNGSLANGAGAFNIGNTASVNAVMSIASTGTIQTSNVNLGTVTSGVGALYQSSGVLTVTNGAAVQTDFALGNAGGAYGYYNLSGGTLNTNEIDVGVGGTTTPAPTGVWDMTGGTVNDAGYLTISRNQNGSIGVANILGGTVNLTGTVSGTRIFMGRAGSTSVGVLTIGGGPGAASVLGPTTGTTFTLDLGAQGGALNAGTQVANLLTNGTLQIYGVTMNDSLGTGIFDFNGGTLKATVANSNFIATTNITGVYVYGNGGTIDNNGVAITVGRALLAPTGNGVATPTITTGGSGYIGAPAVTITGGGGVGATAYAVLTNGVVTGIVITNPGTGYTSAPTYTLTGGGPTTAATITATTNVANVSGGMTYQGTGTTTLTGASTYTGGTTVNAGVVTVGTGGTLGATTGGLTVNNANTGAGTAVAVNLATAADTTIGSLSGTIATPSSGSNTATINTGGSARNFTINQTANATFGGVIAGTGSVTIGSLSTKALTLSGANTYTGPTAINAGTLNVNGSLASSSVSVNNTGTLGGTGTISGTVALAAGGTISTVDGTIGTLTTGALTIGSGSSAMSFDIGAGTTGNLDKLAINGALSSSGTTSITIGYVSGTPTIASGTYTLITYTGTQLTTAQLSSEFSLATTSLGGRTLTLTQNVGTDAILLSITGGVNATTYTLATTAGSSRIMSGQSTTLSTTLTNTGTTASNSDTLNYTGLGATGTTVTGTTTSGGPVAINGGTATITTQTFSDTTAGAHTITPTVTTATNATAGGSATQTGTTTAVVSVLNNRTETASAVALGRVLVNGTTGSQTTTISSPTLQDSSLTRTTLGGSAQASTVTNGTVTLASGTAYQFGNGNDATNSTTRGVTGVFTAAGNQSGTANFTPTGEGLTGESVNAIGVAYTADAVNQRSFSVGTSPVALGRFLLTSTPTGSTAITSTGLNVVTGNASLGSFSTVNGLSLTTGDATAFNGATSSQTANYTVGGTASGAGNFSGSFSSTMAAELGSISAVTVAVTGDAVNQRAFSVGTSPVALGRFLLTSTPTGSTAITSTGLNAVTGNASLGSFSSVNGLSLTTGDSTAFNGAASSQTANYTVGGTASGAGNFSGSFSSTVSAELGSIAPVTVAVTGDAVNQRTFSVGTSPVALGRFLITSSPTGSTAITSTGLNAVTGNASLGSFSSVNGLSLTTGDATAFNGGSSSQTANYSIGGTASSAGSFSGNFSSTVSAELGSIAPVTVAVTGDAVNQRSFSVTGTPIALGRYLVGTTPSGSVAVSSTGLNNTTGNASLGAFNSVNGLTLTTGDSTAFNGGSSSQTANFTLGGTATTGNFSGTFSSTVSAEFGSIAPVTVAITADAVNQRSFSVGTSPVALGRFLLTSTPTGSTAITSTGLNNVTANASLGSFSSVNGLSLTTGDATAFNGAASSQTANYSVGGTASSAGNFSGSFSSTVGAELGSIAPVTVAVTGDAVNQRTFSVGTSPVALGRFLLTSTPTGSTAITSTGLNAVTGNASLGSFSSVNGLSLTTGDATAFNGGSSSQTANYTVGGTASGAGNFSGSFSSTVSAELGSIAPVTVAVTGDAVNQRTFSVGTSPVALGRFLLTSTPTGSTAITSTGLNAVTGNASLGSFSSVNGLSLTTGDATAFNGATSSQTANYSVGGTASSAGNFSGSFSSTVSAELGSIAPVTVAVTGDAVNQRTFSVGTSPVALGRFLITSSPTGSTAITSTGLNAVTGNASLGSFSSVNGLSLTTGDATAFNGATSSQTANYSIGGTASSAGSFSGNFSSTVSAELGSIAPVTVAVTGDAVNQRSFSVTGTPIALGRYLVGTTPSGSVAVSSTGLNDTTGNASLGAFNSVDGLTLTTTDPTAFNGATSSQTANYALGGTATTGNFSGTFSSTVSAEFGSIAPVTVAITADAVNQRSFSVGTSPVALGRFLISSSPTGSTAITSTGLNNVTANASLGSFSSVNGLNLTTGDATAFNGATSSQTANYSVGGTASSAGSFSGSFSSTVGAELGSIAPVTVAVTGDAVNQRTFSVGTSPVALGRFLISSSPTGSTAITSTGLNDTTGNASLGSFSSVNGLSLTTGDATAFNGGTSSQTANYSVGGTASSAGSFSGSFSSTVSAELGSIAPVTVAVTGDAVNQRSFSVGTSPVALGRFLITSSPTGSTSVTSTGLNDVTGNASLGSFSSVNGLSLTTGDSTAFNGATSSQTANYSVGGTASSAGSFSGSFSSTVGAELGSIAPVTVAVTGDAVNQRAFSVGTSPVALGRFLITSSPTGSTAITSTGLNDTTGNASLGSFSSVNGLSLTTGDSTAFNGGSSSQTANYAVGGTAASAGSFSGSFSSTVGAELGSIAPVTVAVTGDAVNQRSFSVTGTPVALGRYLVGTTPSGSVAVSSTGLNDTTGNASLGAFNSVDGLTLTTTDPTAFNGATSSQTATYALGGTATTGNFSGTFSSTVTAELGSIAPVTVAITADAVNQRTFSVSTSPVALGRFIATATPSGSTSVTSTGLNDVTANASLGTFSTVNGLGLTTGDSTTFNGASSSQTANYAVNGTASGLGSFSGTFSSTVSAELGSIAPVTVAVTGDAVTQRVVNTGAVTDLGFVHSGAAVSATANAFSSTGTHDTTTDVTVAGGDGTTTSNGVTLSGSSTSFNGPNGSSINGSTQTFGGNLTSGSGGTTTGSFNLGVTGEGLTGEGSYSDVNVAYTSFVYTGQGVWNTNGGGSWGAVSETPANWTANGGTPGLDANFTSTDSAFFGSVTTSGTANVTLDGDNPSLNAITFNNGSASYNIGQGTGTGSITLNGGLADATVTNLGGIHEISAPVHLATSADVNVSSGQQLTLSGTLSGPGGLNTTTGSGTTIITGDNSYAGGTAVNAGVLRLSNSSGSATGSGALSVGAGAVLAGSGTSNSSGLSITGDSSTRATVLVGYNNGLDTNTTNVMTLTAPTASLGSARLEFNINANTPGQGTELAIANTAVTFNTVGTLNTQLALNIEGNSFIAAFTPYVLVAGTGTTIMGTGTSALTATATSGQFTGIDTFINAKGQNQIVTGSTQNLQLTFNDPAQAAYYAQSYLFIVNNDGVDDIEVEVVPEPGTWAMMLGGLALLIFWQRRRSKQS